MNNTQYKEQIVKMLDEISSSRILKQLYEIVRALKGVAV